MFSREICEILENTYFEEHCKRLLLEHQMLLVRRGLKVLKQIDMNTITSTFQENSESNLAQCLQNLEEGPLSHFENTT